MARIHAQKCMCHSAPLITLCSKPSSQQHTLLQFINVMNCRLVQPLLRLSPNSVVNLVQIWTAGIHMSGEMKAGVSLPLQTAISRSSVMLKNKALARDLTHDKQ